MLHLAGLASCRAAQLNSDVRPLVIHQFYGRASSLRTLPQYSLPDCLQQRGSSTPATRAAILMLCRHATPQSQNWLALCAW
jgi:hypothetical protein